MSLKRHSREKRDESKRNYYAKGFHGHNMSRYTEWEKSQLMRTDITDTELSKMLGRSIKAIQIKRSRLRKYYDIPSKATQRSEDEEF